MKYFSKLNMYPIVKCYNNNVIELHYYITLHWTRICKYGSQTGDIFISQVILALFDYIYVLKLRGL